MLKLVKGCDRVALTQYAFEHIKETSIEQKAKWVLIVPEQFSFDAERRLCQVGGHTIGRFAEVLSFSRLSERVAAKQGGIAGDYLDKGGQLLTMALAAEQVSSRIKLYASVIRKPEFLTDLVRMIGEFRSYCLQPEELLRVSALAEGQFAQKLEELGILYEAYLAVCFNGKADPSDKLIRLVETLDGCSWAADKRFYIDGFSDFTGIELRVIELLTQNAKEVIVSLPTGNKGSAVYTIAEKTGRELELLAKKHMLPFASQTIGDAVPRERSLQLFLERLFSYGKTDEVSSEQIKLISCSSVEEECRAAALEAAKLLMKGARCREISVVCANLAQYEIPLKHVFKAAGIPAYFAGERALLSKPIITSVLNSLFAAAGPMEYEEVASYLKSGLAPITMEKCDRLDNYAYLWSIRGSTWFADWKLHPKGFGEQFTEEDKTYLSALNIDRKKAMKPLLELRKGLNEAKDTAEMVLSLYDFLEEVELRERLEKRASEYAEEGKGQATQELSQIHEILVQSLEQMWLVLGKTKRSAEDFCRLYQTVLTQYEVSTIPAGVDQIQVSNVPDMRYRRTKHMIVLGASDGNFPAYKAAEGLLTEEERRGLMMQGLSIAPGRAERLEQEMSTICLALAATSESICFTYSGDQPAWLFRRAAALCPGAVCSFEKDVLLNVGEFAAKRVRERREDPCSVAQLRETEAKLEILSKYSFTPLKAHTVAGLYGEPISLSPSKIDKFAACRFGFYMAYGLKAKPRKQAKLDQPAFGTFVHEVLEHTVRRVNEAGGFKAVSQELLLNIATEEIIRYADTHFPEQAKREEYLFNRSKLEIRDIVLDLWEELRRSEFQPEYCELRFADGDMLPAVQISGADAVCKVIGMVDRVDVYKDGEKNYVRVVDYKTGFKEFDYTDILNGAGLQMLIYLFALQSCGEKLLGSANVEPAGVLYLPAKKAYPLTEAMPDDGVVLTKHRELRRRKGLIRSDENLLAAMEEDPTRPQFMPYKMGRTGIAGDLADKQQMRMLERHVTRTIGEMADQISSGDVAPNPIVRGQYGSCKYCDYKMICHKDLGTHKERVLAETNAKKFWEKLEQEDAEHG